MVKNKKLNKIDNSTYTRDFPVVQWLILHAPNAGGPALIPGQGTRSRMPQLRARVLQLDPVQSNK